jgi:hypothetical protein
MTPIRAELTPAAALLARKAAKDAALLPMIKAALERRHVSDAEVWDGYPCSAAEDDESDYLGGLLLNLERCARLDQSGVTTKAIRIAFELGQASIVGTTDPEKMERFLTNTEKQERRYKKGGATTGPEAAADAKERNRVLKDVWRAYRGQFGDGWTLAKKVYAGECKYADDSGEEQPYTAALSVEGARMLFRQWAQEAVIAAERETWATSGWSETKVWPGEPTPKHIRSTRDGYTVELSEEDDCWLLKVRMPVAGDEAGDGFLYESRARTHAGVSLDDAKAGSYALIEWDREQEPLKKREWREFRKRMKARGSRDSWRW